MRTKLANKPQTFQEIHPQFTQSSAWKKSETELELQTLLEQNFLCFEGKDAIPAQIVSWMMKSANLRELMNVNSEKDASGALHTSNSTLLREAEHRWYVPDPQRAGDLEKLREKALLKEFDLYKTTKKTLKVFRLEAVRAGFKKAWQERDYATILAVGKIIPSVVLDEDLMVRMWYDQAVTRMGGERDVQAITDTQLQGLEGYRRHSHGAHYPVLWGQQFRQIQHRSVPDDAEADRRVTGSESGFLSRR